jgi:hypothetical protein
LVWLEFDFMLVVADSHLFLAVVLQARKAAERGVSASKEAAWREKLNKERRKARYIKQVGSGLNGFC